ncbi:hypothetical protein RSC2_02289 [Bacillus paralicheniformis]|nr:hypothetical protein RSC2_02289 [Bacillus paralicheniformis]
MQMGDTVFMFFCALLVWLMTPGIALFYGGLVRSKNVLSTVMHSLSSIAIVSIIWILFGYSLAFAPGNPLIGVWIGSDCKVSDLNPMPIIRRRSRIRFI